MEGLWVIDYGYPHCMEFLISGDSIYIEFPDYSSHEQFFLSKDSIFIKGEYNLFKFRGKRIQLNYNDSLVTFKRPTVQQLKISNKKRCLYYLIGKMTDITEDEKQKMLLDYSKKPENTPLINLNGLNDDVIRMDSDITPADAGINDIQKEEH